MSFFMNSGFQTEVALAGTLMTCIIRKKTAMLFEFDVLLDHEILCFFVLSNFFIILDKDFNWKFYIHNMATSLYY